MGCRGLPCWAVGVRPKGAPRRVARCSAGQGCVSSNLHEQGVGWQTRTLSSKSYVWIWFFSEWQALLKNCEGCRNWAQDLLVISQLSQQLDHHHGLINSQTWSAIAEQCKGERLNSTNLGQIVQRHPATSKTSLSRDSEKHRKLIFLYFCFQLKTPQESNSLPADNWNFFTFCGNG